MLNLLHGALIRKEPKFRNLLAQNKYYFIPAVNPDGLALVEDYFTDNNEIMKKRKNMSPEAQQSMYSKEVCKPEDSGVDLNRNWGVDFYEKVSQEEAGPQDKVWDDCSDPCGECYRGKEPFSEPETRALRDFLTEHKDEIKFVSNTHSYGNMWIYPYNGQAKNNIEERNPTQFLALKEIAEGAKFP